jgi:hypothetical protein
LLLGNSNATYPQAARGATDETRAEREPSLQRKKTEFVLEQCVNRERERERERGHREGHREQSLKENGRNEMIL